ncbi:MAG: hypothetical protein QW835_07520 [Candidatus Hadarchaeum sp.]
MPTFDETVVKITADTSELESETQKGGRLIDKFIRDTQRRASILNRIKMSPSVTLIDRISGPLRTVERNLNRLSAVKKVTIEAVDRTTNLIKRITGTLTSPLGLLGGGAGIYGIGKLTLGQAMEFETRQVAMEHWLKGNKTLAKEVTSWLEQLAAATPFEMGDLFPAMSRAVGISDGDIKMAERMVKLATDMAGLTPGKTVQDAMEALADAQMGEFERMKEFSMKVTQEQFKAWGGFEGFIKKAQERFAGGAEKLSQTAIGRISTITDNIKTLFRSAGIGALETIKPRLEKIIDWFDKNQKTVSLWRDRLTSFGRQAFEGILSSGERFFGRLMAKFEDPGFQKLSWGEKVVTLLDETAKIALPKAAEIGTQIGVQFAVGIGRGILDAAAKDPLVAAVIGAWVGSKVPGPPVVKISIGASIAATPLVTEAAKTTITDIMERRKMAGWKEATEWFAERVNITPSGTPLISGGELRARHALGGIFTRPHLGLVAEAGPEAWIPLSQRMRPRALALWEQVGDYLGVKSYAEGGFTGPVAVAGVGGEGNINVTVAGITVNVASSRLDEDSLALSIGRHIVSEIKKSLENRA